MLVVTRADIESLLDLDQLVDAVASAMADLSAGRASMPTRVAAEVPEAGTLFAMPAFLPSAQALTTKLVSLFPQNRDRPTHQAVVVCFDAANGTPTALLDATATTAARTAAGSALSVELLARPDARSLTILGTGVQARAHARAVARVRPFERIRIAGRDSGKAQQLAAELAAELDLPVVAESDLEVATRDADVVCATTHSPDPVLHRAWLSPGTHVTSVGYNPEGRELDAATVVDAVVVVESRASALAPPPSGSNDLLWPIRDGLIGPDHVRAEIGELVAGTAVGRTSPDEITLYKSVGVAVQDAAAAALVLEAARARGVGTQVEM